MCMYTAGVWFPETIHVELNHKSHISVTCACLYVLDIKDLFILYLAFTNPLTWNQDM